MYQEIENTLKHKFYLELEKFETLSNSNELLIEYQKKINNILEDKVPCYINKSIKNSIDNQGSIKEKIISNFKNSLDSENIDKVTNLIKQNENNKEIQLILVQSLNKKLDEYKIEFNIRLDNIQEMIEVYHKVNKYNQVNQSEIFLKYMHNKILNKIDNNFKKISNYKQYINKDISEFDYELQIYISHYKEYLIDKTATYFASSNFTTFINNLTSRYITLTMSIENNKKLKEFDECYIEAEFIYENLLSKFILETDIANDCDLKDIKFEKELYENERNILICSLKTLNLKNIYNKSLNENTKELELKKSNCSYLKIKDYKTIEVIKEKIKSEVDHEFSSKLQYLESNLNIEIGNEIANEIEKLKLINEIFLIEIDLDISNNFRSITSKINTITSNIMSNFRNVSQINKENSGEFVSQIKLLRMLCKCIEPIDANTASRSIDKIKSLIEQLKSTQEGIFVVAVELDKDEIGRLITNENSSTFVNYYNKVFTDKIVKKSIKQIVDLFFAKNKNLQEKFSHNECENWYYNYKEEYEQVIKEYLTDREFNLKKKVVNELLKEKNETDFTTQKNYWSLNQFEKLPKTIAKICAIKHILDREENKCKKSETFYWEANACQILGIMMILRTKCTINSGVKSYISSGFSTGSPFQKQRGLINNLCEILTGEGKSILLGVCATILALYGFQVYCTSYSDNLSTRDYDDFKKIFEILNLKDYIVYGTFNNLSETLINREIDLRGYIKNIVNGNIPKESDQKIYRSLTNKRVNVLLIDEVDSFLFDENVANPYITSTVIKGQEITDILDYVWTNRSSIKFDDIVKNSVYNNLLQKYKSFEPLFEALVKSIFIGLGNYCKYNRVYDIKEGKICYVNQDYSSSNISYGFETTFAYYKALEDKKISHEDFKSFIIKCGKFSSSEIVKDYFPIILGVTGTLSYLSDKQYNLLQKYNIHKENFIFVPTIFIDKSEGSRFRFNPESNTKLVKESREIFHSILCNRISELQKTDNIPILVIFENLNSLQEFRNSECFNDQINCKVLMLTELQNNKEKNETIRGAVMPDRLTLITKSFGRGTDFRSHLIKGKNQGPHIIQTFFSEEISEEIQIKGRTARQNDSGSYEIILYKEDIEKYFCDSEKNDIEKIDADKLYKILDEKRKLFTLMKDKDSNKILSFTINSHIKSIEFKNKIIKEKDKISLNYLADELLQWNSYQKNSGVCRVMIIYDATGSMSNVFPKLIIFLNSVFTRTQKILNDSGKSNLGTLIKVGIYRNYNCSLISDIYECSDFHHEASEISAYVNSKSVSGGLGDEAVELALQNVNFTHSKDPLSQVILIGDADAQSENDAEKNRNAYKHNYKGTLIETPTNYKKEIPILVSNKIKVHSFSISSKPFKTFKEISDATGGSCNLLEVSNDKSTELMTNIICKEILNNLV